MNPTLLVTLVLGAVVAGVLLVLLVVLLRDRARSRALLEQTRAESAELRQRLDALGVQVAAARQSTQRAAQPEEYVITHLGEDDVVPTGSDTEYGAASDTARIDGRLFADIVLRETVVKAASLGHGVRRAMAPETRNRIRFEMRREVKSRRKARKDELRQLRRTLQDQRRAATT